MNKIRISKYLADCGLGSRRKCENLVLEGKVTVNGDPVKELFYKVSSQDQVLLEGKPVNPEPKIVIALNKPAGYLSTVKDDFNRKKVTDLLDNDLRLYPVGRLDYNSRGLLIMTNNGYLAYRITHPKFNIPKTYKVKVKGLLSKKDLNKIDKGISIEDREVAIVSTRVTQSSLQSSELMLALVEGRKRIIRRVFKKLGYQLLDLQRTKIGSFCLGDLPEGKYKVLNTRQINQLTSV
ncbi:MAG: pseudouridine synthase [Actinomycetota bacterium]|nr:pseudouridine synthase [Actinomycetota bacterium]